MAFKISLATEGTYRWPVTVLIPVDGGTFKKEEFTAVFKRYKKNEMPESDTDEKLNEERGIEFFKKILVNWSGIQDDQGNEIPYSEEKLIEFLGVPVFTTAVIKAYQASMDMAKEKN